jgi:3-methyladenine DNA glycosylase AlkD
MKDVLQKKLRELADAEDAHFLQRFFKTGKGEYGEGDVFIGVRVPQIRKLAKRYPDVSLGDLQGLLGSRIHEERLLALIMLIHRFQKVDSAGQKACYEFYLKNIQNINNWDLVDISAEKIMGAYLFSRSRKPLETLLKSDNLWKRRMAIMATFYFIKQGDFEATLEYAKYLLNDREDLIHKAVGWMLREVGKRDREEEEQFLRQHYRNMPRTMLRYAIEKFPESRRRQYLNGKI